MQFIPLNRLTAGVRFCFAHSTTQLLVLFCNHDRMVVQDARTGACDTITLTGPMAHIAVQLC